MPHIKTSPDHPSSMAERVAKRLRNSGDVQHADVSTVHGTGPTRTHTNIHHSANHVLPPDTRGKDIKTVAKG